MLKNSELKRLIHSGEKIYSEKIRELEKENEDKKFLLLTKYLKGKSNLSEVDKLLMTDLRSEIKNKLNLEDLNEKSLNI